MRNHQHTKEIASYRKGRNILSSRDVDRGVESFLQKIQVSNVQLLCHLSLFLLFHHHPTLFLFLWLCWFLPIFPPLFHVPQILQHIKGCEVLEREHASTGDSGLVADVGGNLLDGGLRCASQYDVPGVQFEEIFVDDER